LGALPAAEPEAILVFAGLADEVERARERGLLAGLAAGEGAPTVTGLDRENAALRAANAKLMRERLGSSDTAAASRLAQRRPAPGVTAVRMAGRAVLAPVRAARLALRKMLLRVMR
jgi:hypothetical protein